MIHNDRVDAFIERGVMEIFGRPGMMTGFVVCAAITDMNGVTRYVMGNAKDQQLHVTAGLTDILAAEADFAIESYGAEG